MELQTGLPVTGGAGRRSTLSRAGRRSAATATTLLGTRVRLGHVRRLVLHRGTLRRAARVLLCRTRGRALLTVARLLTVASLLLRLLRRGATLVVGGRLVVAALAAGKGGDAEGGKHKDGHAGNEGNTNQRANGGNRDLATGGQVTGALTGLGGVTRRTGGDQGVRLRALRHVGANDSGAVLGAVNRGGNADLLDVVDRVGTNGTIDVLGVRVRVL